MMPCCNFLDVVHPFRRFLILSIACCMNVPASTGGSVDGGEMFFETAATLFTFICFGQLLETVAKGVAPVG